MTPMARYQQALKAAGFQRDPAQEAVVARLEQLWQALQTHRSQPLGAADSGADSRAGLLGKLFGRRAASAQPPQAPHGLYIWGGVGRGKTHLCDLFFDSLPFDAKLRLHFHRFMRLVHEELRALKDVRDPLALVADQFAARTRVLCLDEMHVHDITDAMIMANLLDGLFRRGVVLVTTSNSVPAELYKGGLQRARFLPAIELIERHCEVVNLDSDTDYRLRALEQAQIYHCPLDAAADRALDAAFHSLAALETRGGESSIEINGRDIPVVKWADGVVWFEFDTLCNTPRSQHDYIEIAEYFHTVLIGGLPRMDKYTDDAARRFVNLIDEFYDRNVKLILSAAVPPEQLYSGQRLAFMFERTASRLREMQSHEYLARQHLG